MASKKQPQAAKENVRKAQSAAQQKRSLANMPKSTKTALGVLSGHVGHEVDG